MSECEITKKFCDIVLSSPLHENGGTKSIEDYLFSMGKKKLSIHFPTVKKYLDEDFSEEIIWMAELYDVEIVQVVVPKN